MLMNLSLVLVIIKREYFENPREAVFCFLLILCHNLFLAFVVFMFLVWFSQE